MISCEKQNEYEYYESVSQIINESVSKIKVFDKVYLDDISFADDAVGFISGHYEYAVITKTTDGGNNWREIPVIIDGQTIRQIEKIYAKNRNEIYGSFWDSEKGTCFSNDGGKTWTIINNLSWRELFFTTPQVGFMVHESGDILKTQDGGKNWSTVQEAFGGIKYPNQYLENCFFTSENIGYAFGGATIVDIEGGGCVFGGIIKTTDGGNTWFRLDSWNDSDNPVELVFTDDNTGYAFSSIGNIYRTTDGGITWVLFEEATDIGYVNNAVITKSDDIYINKDRGIYKTTNKFESLKNIYYGSSIIGKIIQIPDKSIFAFSIDDSSVIKIDL